jgi:hypothetical protein
MGKGNGGKEMGKEEENGSFLKWKNPEKCGNE